MASLLSLQVTNNCDDLEPPSGLLQKVLEDAYGERSQVPASMNLMIIGDNEIAVINSRYLDHEGPTDVISFTDGEEDPESGLLHLGDVAISADTARREAKSRNVNFDHELVLYSLHGLLHLLGMEDYTPTDRAGMISAQRNVFTRHGLDFDMED